MILFCITIIVIFLIGIYRYVAARLSCKRFDGADFGVQQTLPLRGLLAILVIVHHVAQMIGPESVLFSFAYWGKYIVALFFFISGFGLVKSYLLKGPEYLNSFLGKHLFKLLPPYIFCIFVYQFFRYLCVDSYCFNKEIFSLGYDIFDSLLPCSWFVVAIILFYIAFFVILKFNDSFLRSLGLLCIFTVLYIVFCRLLHLGIWWYESIIPINLGMVFAYIEHKYRHLILLQPLISAGICILLVLLVYLILPGYIIRLGLTAQLVYHFLQIAICPVLVMTSIYLTGFVANPVLQWLGKISFEIYLVQGIFCMMVHNIKLPVYAFLLIVIASSILCAYGLKFLYEKITKF